MLNMVSFYSAKAKAPLAERNTILNTSIVDLLDYLVRFPDDPTALATVILSSYGTWRGRSMYWDEETDPTVKKMRKAEKRPSVGWEDDDIDVADEAELDQEQLNRIHSYCPGVFGRVIDDHP